MGLQVRVRHALGDRLIELPDRDIDNPVTVGRAAGSEVQVPSVGVAARHCVLFRFEGHWAVQDVGAANGGSTSGTWVNGHPVGDPVMLQIGDVISIGSEASAPTIEVDPAAAAEGRSGWAGDDATAPLPPGHAIPGVPGYTAAHPGYPAAPSPGAYGGGYVAPAAVPGVPSAGPALAAAPSPWAAPSASQEAGGFADPSDPGDQADLGALGSAPATPYRRSGRKKKARTSESAILVGILAAAVIIGGTAWVVYEKTSAPEVAVAPPKKPVVDDSSRHRGNIFDGMGGSGTSGGSSSPATPPAPPPVSPGAGTPHPTDTTAGPSDTSPGTTSPNPPGSPSSPADTGARPPATKPASPDEMASAGSSGTPANPGDTSATRPVTPPAPAGPADEWAEMTDLHNATANPAIALFRFHDFGKQHPGQHADDLKAYMEEKFDQLWWDRIAQLFRMRDRLLVDIKKKQDAIWEETDPAMKKQEKDEKDSMEKKLKATKETLAVKMSYTADEPPPVNDSSALATLREKRDPAKYTEWKRTTLNGIVNNKGKTEWEADN